MWLGQHAGLTHYAAVRCWQFLPLPRRSPPFRDFHLRVHDPFFLLISASTAASLPRGSDTADLKETGGRFCRPRAERRRQPSSLFSSVGFTIVLKLQLWGLDLNETMQKLKKIKAGGCVSVLLVVRLRERFTSKSQLEMYHHELLVIPAVQYCEQWFEMN